MKSILLGVAVAAVLGVCGWWQYTHPVAMTVTAASAPANTQTASINTQDLQAPAELTKGIIFTGEVLEKAGEAPYYGVPGWQYKVRVTDVATTSAAHVSGDIIITTTFENIVAGSSTLRYQFHADLNHTTGWYEVTSYRGFTYIDSKKH